MPFSPPAAAEQQPLTLGERLCDLPLADTGGRIRSLYDARVFGWPKVLHLANAAADAEPELRRLAERLDRFHRAETLVLAVTRAPAAENAALAGRLKLPFPLMSDAAGGLHRAAGLRQGEAPLTLCLDPLLRLERRIEDGDGASQAAAALAHAEARFAEYRPAVTALQAPALIVPNVLDPEHCRRLIALWETGEKRDDAVSSARARVRSNPKSKIRSDVYLPVSTPECDELIALMRRRLFPEVAKAFNFEITRLEHFRIGCYDAARGGHFAAHRDNAKEVTAHRRYALTLNLNTGDYDGGFLRLPEYGPQLYAPPAGGAVVFSCSLLHLATPVTRGRRFALVGFFWGEAEQPIFERSHAEMFPGGTDVNLIR